MSQRTEQVASELQNLLGEAFIRELEMPDGILPTVNQIEVPPDLKAAKIYVSFLPHDKSKQGFNYLKKRKGALQQYIAKHLVMKMTPKLEFFLDNRPYKAAQIEALIDENPDENPL